jgi:hypothetical protein
MFCPLSLNIIYICNFRNDFFNNAKEIFLAVVIDIVNGLQWTVCGWRGRSGESVPLHAVEGFSIETGHVMDHDTEGRIVKERMINRESVEKILALVRLTLRCFIENVQRAKLIIAKNDI